MVQNIRIVKNEETPETPELLAESIVRVGKAFARLTEEGLTENGIVALLKGMKGMQTVPTSSIRLILRNLPKLSSYYVRKPIKK